MGAGGYLGDHAAVAGVLCLRVYDVREGLASVGFHDRGAGVVTGGFDGQDHGLFIAFGRIEETDGLRPILAGRGRHRRAGGPTGYTRRYADVLTPFRLYSAGDASGVSHLRVQGSCRTPDRVRHLRLLSGLPRPCAVAAEAFRAPGGAPAPQGGGPQGTRGAKAS